MNDDELDLWLSIHNDQLDEQINARVNLELRRQQVRSATASEPPGDEPDMTEVHAIWAEQVHPTDSRSRRGRVRRAITRPASIRPPKRSSTRLSARYKRKSADATRSMAVIFVVLCMLVLSAVVGNFVNQRKTALPPSELVIGIALAEGAGMVEEIGRSKFAIELADWLADNLHYSPVKLHSFIDSGDNVEMLRRGEVDMIITSKPVTDQPGAEVLFTGPYLMVQGGVLVRAGSTAIRTIEDLAGKRVCTWDGAKYREQSMRLGNSVPVEKDLLSSCLDALKSGDLDAVAGDRLLLWGIAKADGLGELSVVPGLNFGDRQRYGIELARGNLGKCNEVRDAIRRFITSGAWDRVFEAAMPDLSPAMLRPDADHLDRCG